MLKQLCVILVLIFLGLSIAPAGSPVQISYVYSDSMEPTIHTNDGFFVTSSNSIEAGDIVTFWAPQRDSYVTHRVVGQSDSGYITKGDNNPTSDQSTGYSHVKQNEIVGEVVTYHGAPILIPKYGSTVSALRGYSPVILLGLGLLLLIRMGGTATQGARPTRSVLRIQDVMLPLLVVSVVSLVGFMLVGASVHQFTFVAVATTSDTPNIITVGESKTTTMMINRSTTPFTRSVVTAENMQITEQSRNESSITVTTRIPPPESTGRYVSRLSTRHYPAVLPLSLLQQLDRIHPVIPASISTLLVMTPVYLLSLLIFDRKTPVRPSRSRWLYRLKEVVK
ncbi:signal peptidase I [Haloarcula amylovorans]|uniref:signal peptidase I n=1 Tax=Haloarcula amylovorans TaxID=2562280 RepID=UPI00142F9104|nr:signal peptidase I [Halomicroarcula amylolytica]